MPSTSKPIDIDRKADEVADVDAAEDDDDDDDADNHDVVDVMTFVDDADAIDSGSKYSVHPLFS